VSSLADAFIVVRGSPLFLSLLPVVLLLLLFFELVISNQSVDSAFLVFIQFD